MMNDEDARIEKLLAGYRPKGPPTRLREWVMRSVELRRLPWRRTGWMAVAAMLLLSFGLNLLTESMARDTVDMLQVQRIEWTPEAQEIADELDGDGWGRQYIALAMVADSYKVERYSPAVDMTHLTGDLR